MSQHAQQLVVVVGGLAVLLAFVATSWKVLRFIFRVDRALPTLLNIAAQFEANHGSTLRDKIEELHAGAGAVDLRVTNIQKQVTRIERRLTQLLPLVVRRTDLIPKHDQRGETPP